MAAKGVTVKAGDIVTIDGSTGEIMLGKIPTVQPELSGDFSTLMGWADEVRRLRVRANAETPLDARTARAFGAEGIGLCRTEHMFFDADRIIAMREMIVADDEKGRRAALAKLEPIQTKDFIELFHIMEGLPVTIRLLDPPLHEFLPKTEAEMHDVAKAAGTDIEKVRKRAHQLHESNPMLGHRGCRLGISYPEIYEIQARAIFMAVAILHREGRKVMPEVMIPLIATKKELDILKAMVERVAGEVAKAADVSFEYLVGTMIELPRAALRAGEIAESAEFFSFGTNDLTQTTFGLSRDDANSFLPDYFSKNVLEHDPFATLDQDGVGELICIAVERGRKARPELKLGICGEHGGDPESVKFCHRAGLDYVSCSPYRVPIARLAAAHAVLENEKDIEARRNAA
jgi:pyruvate,orthophosphate dikinase